MVKGFSCWCHVSRSCIRALKNVAYWARECNYICRTHNGPQEEEKGGGSLEKGWWVQPVSFPHPTALQYYSLKPIKYSRSFHSLLRSTLLHQHNGLSSIPLLSPAKTSCQFCTKPRSSCTRHKSLLPILLTLLIN